MKPATIYVIGLLSGIAISAGLFFAWNSQKPQKIHILKAPLILSSSNSGGVSHLLPVGTTLYLDQSFPEGFTRYGIYVNVDRMPLALRELIDPSEIDPLEARAFDNPSLAKALRDYPLTRDELAAILQSPQLTKQDVREIFKEYLEKNQ